MKETKKKNYSIQENGNWNNKEKQVDGFLGIKNLRIQTETRGASFAIRMQEKKERISGIENTVEDMAI